MKKSFYILILIILSNLAYAQQEEFTIKGNVRCSETNEALVGVNIYTQDKAVGLTTNTEGNFIINNVQKDSLEVFFSFLGYKTESKFFSADNNIAQILLKPAEFSLKEVTILSAKNEMTSFNQITPANIISSQRIEEVCAQNIPEFVAVSPSVSLAGAGYHKSMSIRGLARKRTLILIDGHRVSTERNAGPPGTFINPLAIKRIEILRGPYSTLYGSDAVGGVINILTKDYLTGLTNQYVGGAFSINYRSASQGYNTNILLNGNIAKNLKFQLTAGKRKANSYRDANGNAVMSTNYSEQNLAGKLFWDINKNHKITLYGLLSKGDSIGKPAYIKDINALHPNDDNSRISLNYHWNRTGKIFERMTINTAFHRHEITARVYNYSNSEYGRVVNKIKNLYNNDISYQQDFNFSFSHDLKLLSGFDFYQRDGIHIDEQSNAFLYSEEDYMSLGEQVYTGSIDSTLHNSYQRSTGIFSQITWQPNEKFMLNGGIRYNHFKTHANLTIKKTYIGPPYDYSQNEKEVKDKDDAAFSGNIGALYSPVDFIKISINAGQAFRTPSTKELFVNTMTPGGMNISNSELKPEESFNIDMGVKLIDSEFDFVALNFFRNDIENMIILQWDSLHTSGQFQNKNALLYGLELEFRQHFLKRFEASGNSSWIIGAEDSGEPLMDIPPLQINLGLSGQIIRNKLKAGLSGRYNAKQTKIATGDVPTDAFFVMDFYSHWRINKYFKANFSVTNLFNKQYREHHQFDWVRQAGRSYNIGLQIRF